jgi:hypothetical protein
MSDDREEEYVVVRLPVKLRLVELEEIKAATDGQFNLRRAAPLSEEPANDPMLGSLRDLAARKLRVRRRRERELGAHLFADPAWDMLLDLFVQRVDGKTTGVSSACIGSSAPPTTALRYLTMLEDAGLVHRMPASDDARRVLVALSDKAFFAMQRLLSP